MTGRKCEPGCTCRKHSAETRAKMAASKRGKKHSAETIAKFRASRRLAEYRARQRAIALANWKKPGYRLNVMRGILAGRLEDQLAAMFDDAGIDYRRQVRVGRYTCDFLLEGRVVCEVFGCFFHGCPEHGRERRADMRDYDDARMAAIRSKDFGTLVIWEHDLRADPVAVLDAVDEALGAVYA